jgi:hypothetical protein
VPTRISRRFLLSLYLAVPFSVLLVAVDVLFLNGWVKSHLPFVPEQLAGYTVLFNAPHLVASELTFFDRDYLSYYRKQLLLGIPTSIAIVLLVIHFCTLAQMQMVNVALVNYHLMAQQIGLSRPMTESRGPWLDALKWMAVVVYIAAFAPVFFPTPGSQPFIPVVWNAALLLLIPMAYAFTEVYRGARTTVGRLYVLGNALMLAAMIPGAKLGYFFFLILVPRLVHDFTAYSFYVTHDRNRNREVAHNVIYRWVRGAGVPVAVLFPVLSIALAYGLSHALDGRGFALFIGPIALFHYFIEGVIWKGSAPHRSSIAFA